MLLSDQFNARSVGRCINLYERANYMNATADKVRGISEPQCSLAVVFFSYVFEFSCPHIESSMHMTSYTSYTLHSY